MLAVPYVLKRGVDISGHGNHKGRSYDTVTFAGRITINGSQEGIVAVVVRRTKGNRFHAHRILMPDGSEFVFDEKVKAQNYESAGVKGNEYRQGPAISSVLDNSISQTDDSVNRKFSTDALVTASGREQRKNTAEGGVKYSLRKYTQHEKENWKNSKRIVLYESDEQLESFIRTSTTDNTFNKKMYFGAVPVELARLIEQETGVNVEGYNCSLGANEIRKIFNDHGNESKEAPRGQRAITESDIKNIHRVIQSPVSVEKSPQQYNGKPVLVFTGDSDGRLSVVAVVSDKRLDLFVQTAYVSAKKGNLATPTGEQAPINTPEANSGTVSKDSIPHESDSVKNEFSV